MMRALPNARLLVHPRGVPHMVDPARLIAGVTAVYGSAEVRRLYGEILPIEEARIVRATHGLMVDLAGRALPCLDTPGMLATTSACMIRRVPAFSPAMFSACHTVNWIPMVDSSSFRTTTPVQFDPEAMHASIDLVMSYRPEVLYLAHCSQLREVETQSGRLHELIDAHVRIARQHQDAGDERHLRIRGGLQKLLLSELARFGCCLPIEQVVEIFATDLELNAQWLGVWLDSLA
jgi:hypothetical protein